MSLELYLITDRDTEIANTRDRRFQLPPRLVHCSSAERRKHKAAPLVETERFEIVVRRHEPHPFTVRDLATQRIQERAPDAPVSLDRRDEGDFARAVLAPIGQQADWAGGLLGHEAGEREDVDQLAAPGLETTSEVGVKQALRPRAIRLGVRANYHDRDSLRLV
jgi:hypothetical protein